MTSRLQLWCMILAIFAMSVISCNSHADEVSQSDAFDRLAVMTAGMARSYSEGKMPPQVYVHLFQTRKRAARLIARWEYLPHLENDAMDAFREFEGEYRAVVGDES